MENGTMEQWNNGTGNGNGKWKMGNGKWKMGNGKRRDARPCVSTYLTVRFIHLTVRFLFT